MDAVEAIERNRLAVPSPLAARQQADGGYVRREVEAFGRQRPLQGLSPVKRQHAFTGVAVEFDIDAGKSDGSADDIGLRLEREAAEAATWGCLLARPAQCVAQGYRVGGKRPFHPERRPVADVAVECKLERCASEADLETGSVAVQSGNEVGEADGSIDRLVVPGEAAGGGETPRDRGPGKRHFHVRERLDDPMSLVAQDDGAVLNSDLRKRRCPPGAGLEVSGQRLDVARPVRAAVGVEDDRDGWAHQRDVRDLDAPGQEGKKPQAGDHLLGRERRGAGSAVAEAHIVEAHRSGRE